MKELRRLLQGGATEAERALLTSARADAPSEDAAERLSLALTGLAAGDPGADGPGSALDGSSPNPGTHLNPYSMGALAKVGVLALVGLGGLGAGVLVQHMHRQRAVPAQALRESVSVPNGPTIAPAEVVATPRDTEPPAVSPVPRGPTAAPRQGTANVAEEDLSAEIRILDVARAAVDARKPGTARRALESYLRRFPQGRLEPEAMVLRLAVLVQQGDRAAASSLAAQLLSSAAYKPYEQRIRSLLREMGE